MQRIKIQRWRWYSNRERLVSNLSHCNLKSRKLENPNWELRAVISWVKIKTPTRLPKIHLSEWSAIILIQCPNNNLPIRSRLETRAKLINLGKWWKIPIKMSQSSANTKILQTSPEPAAARVRRGTRRVEGYHHDSAAICRWWNGRQMSTIGTSQPPLQHNQRWMRLNWRDCAQCDLVWTASC